MEKQYAERDPIALDKAGGYFTRHLAAMTAEGLHDKSAIAEELAHRDMELDRLKKALRAAQEFIARFTSGNSVPRDVRFLAVQAGPTIAQEATFLRDQINAAMNGANDKLSGAAAWK